MPAITPDDLSGVFATRCITIPGDVKFLAAVIGALSILGEDWYWDDSHGGVSAADAAEASREMVYALEDCLQPMEIVAARYYKTSALNLLTGVTTLIDYAQQDYDTHSAVTTGAAWKFTVPTGLGGLYYVDARLGIANNAGWLTTEFADLFIYKNGAQSRFLDRRPGNTVLQVMVQGACIMSLVPGDDIDVRAAQNSGNTIGIATGASVNEIAIHRLMEEP